MQISHDKRSEKLWLSQKAYVEKVLKKFNMSKAKSICSLLAGHFNLSSKRCPTNEKEKQEMRWVPYASTVGSLTYVMVYIKLDITHLVCVVSWFFSNPGKQHWTVVKRILRYPRGTCNACLYFDGDKLVLQLYTDVDIDSKKSLSGYIAHLYKGSNLIAVHTSTMCCSFYHRSRVYCNHWKLQRNLMHKEFPIGVGCQARQLCCILRQLKCHSLGKEFNIPFEIQAHWCEVSLDTRRAWEKTIAAWEDTHYEEWVKYNDKTITQRETQKLYAESGLGSAP